MNKLINFFSANSYLGFIGGLCSIVSFLISIFSNNIVEAILGVCLFVLVFLILLVNQNSKLLRRMDDLKCEIFSSNVDLEYIEENDIYIAQSPIILCLTSFLTPETLSKEPEVFIQVDFPSQLGLDFANFSDYITRIESSSDSEKFKAKLKSDSIILTIQSVKLRREKEDDFMKSSQKINISFESEILQKTKKESLFVSI